jgi:hypothetical protein
MAKSTSKTVFARSYLSEGRSAIPNIPKPYRPKHEQKKHSLLVALMKYAIAEDGIRLYERLLKSDDFLERSTTLTMLSGDDLHVSQLKDEMHPIIPVIHDLLYEIGWGNLCKIEKNSEGYYQLNFSPASCPFEFELSDRLTQALHILTTDFRTEFNNDWKSEELISYMDNDYRSCFIALRHAVHFALIALSRTHPDSPFTLFAFTRLGQTINWKEYKPFTSPVDRMYAEVVRYRKCTKNLDPNKLRQLLGMIKPDDRLSLERFMDYFIPLVYDPFNCAEKNWIDDVQKVMDAKGIKFEGIDQRMFGKYATDAKNIINREGTKVQEYYGRLRRSLARLHVDNSVDTIKQTILEFIAEVESMCKLEMTFEEFLDVVFDTTDFT